MLDSGRVRLSQARWKLFTSPTVKDSVRKNFYMNHTGLCTFNPNRECVQTSSKSLQQPSHLVPYATSKSRTTLATFAVDKWVAFPSSFPCIHALIYFLPIRPPAPASHNHPSLIPAVGRAYDALPHPPAAPSELASGRVRTGALDRGAAGLGLG